MAETRRHSVLIIDDDEDYLEILKRGLSNEFAIITIAGFRNLKEEINGLQPSIILLDHHLGETKPEDVLDFIQSLDFLKGIPIFLISGNDSGRKMAEGYNLSGFMVKPTSLQGIREML
ncbi:MAG: response regulator, partial [Anditalea sp.]